MTPDQMAELAARLRYVKNLLPTWLDDADFNAYESDLDRAADLIEQMAQRTVIPSEDIAWVRFNAAFTDGDAPYPGMIAAFENHYGQSFADKDWRREASVWAQAWHAATRANVASPVAQRVPLSDEQMRALVQPMDWPPSVTEIVRAVEQAHGIRSEE